MTSRKRARTERPILPTTTLELEPDRVSGVKVAVTDHHVKVEGPKGKLERFVAGRIWRYQLEPRAVGTLVRESWDITTDHQRVLLKLGDIYSGKTRRDMELTLARLDTLVTS